MAYADPLTVSPTAPTAGTGSNVTFNKIRQAAQEAERLDAATTLSDPQKLVIKHQTSGSEKAGNLIDRHLVSFSRVERDSSGNAAAAVVNLTISVPRNNMFSTSEVQTQVNMLVNFIMGSGNLAALLQGQS